jgi:hypothetical protein
MLILAGLAAPGRRVATAGWRLRMASRHPVLWRWRAGLCGRAPMESMPPPVTPLVPQRFQPSSTPSPRHPRSITASNRSGSGPSAKYNRNRAEASSTWHWSWSVGSTVTIGAQILQQLGHGPIAHALAPAAGTLHGTGLMQAHLPFDQQPGLLLHDAVILGRAFCPHPPIITVGSPAAIVPPWAVVTPMTAAGRSADR